jgi:alginate O-acetyltransferase complex protein AlgI
MEELLNLFLYQKDEPLLFHHGIFLFLFSNFLILYGLTRKISSIQKWLIILFSMYFYYKSSGIYIILLFTTITSDYLFSIAIQKSKKFKSIITAIGILFSLSFLLYFKYAKLLVETLGYSSADLHVDSLFLPIGISFYTFQSISYLVDIHRNEVQIPKFPDYLLYMTFFPHLVAGPIVRAKDFLPQLTKKINARSKAINEGLYLISKGLIKKAIVADFVGQYVDIIFASPQGSSGMEALIATLCYTLQIFADFSGYTDMAIGISLILGYRLCLNFDSPYQSTSITEFWRRWHISLSNWLRDFVYIPLGGNKKGLILQLLFLLVTMSIGGIWHGASWKFLWWGIGHGAILILHKLISQFISNKFKSRLWNFIGWFFTFTSVAILWIPFRANNELDSWLIIQNIFTKTNIFHLVEICQQNTILITVLIIGFTATLIGKKIKNRLQKWYYREPLIVKLLILIAIIQFIYQLKSATIQPFIYFQF